MKPPSQRAKPLPGHLCPVNVLNLLAVRFPKIPFASVSMLEVTRGKLLELTTSRMKQQSLHTNMVMGKNSAKLALALYVWLVFPAVSPDHLSSEPCFPKQSQALCESLPLSSQGCRLQSYQDSHKPLFKLPFMVSLQWKRTWLQIPLQCLSSLPVSELTQTEKPALSLSLSPHNLSSLPRTAHI